jgi:hypothetical protein
MRTFDRRGNLLGDTTVDATASIDSAVQSQLDTDVAAGAGAAPLTLPLVSIPATSFSIAQLFSPPYVYFVVAALGIAAYLYRKK